MEFDYIIQGGQVLDGRGTPSLQADVGVKDGKIAAVGRFKGTAAQTIDAAGCCVTPGFIDMHSHSDISLVVNPRAESKIRQGVTTEVIGNCGESAAPITSNSLDLFKESFETEALQFELNWLSVQDYLDRLRSQGLGVNAVPLIGHSTIRAAVMGFDNRPPTPAEYEAMKTLIAQAMEEGACGISTGLIYAPGLYASTSELIELSRVVAQYNGLYCSHIRGEDEALLDAVMEALTIGREAGLPVQLSHHKAVGPQNWGLVTKSLRMIDQARVQGLDVTADQYPYIASSNNLASALPSWMHEGGKAKLLERLCDAPVRDRVKQEMAMREGFWDDTRIAYCRVNTHYEGMSVNEVAALRGTSPHDAMFDLLYEEEAHVGVVRFGLSEDDVRMVMRHPMVMAGSDGSALATYGVLHRGKPHPRNYGTFPRILGKYVQEEHNLSLEEAVRKMTSLPAGKLGLKDRGVLQQGYRADVTVFNPQTVRDKATFLDPHQYPEGIEYVMVNGRLIIDRGQHTGVLAGQILKRAG